MRILGIDPGLSGAAAVLVTGDDLDGPARLAGVTDLPVTGVDAKRRIDVCELAMWIKAHTPDIAFIERAGAIRTQGRAQGGSSAFIYGRSVGAVEATVMLCNVPLHFVEAAVWKRHFTLAGGDKEASRQAVLTLMPSAADRLTRKKDHGRAEAVLIAMYGADTNEDRHAATEPHRFRRQDRTPAAGRRHTP